MKILLYVMFGMVAASGGLTIDKWQYWVLLVIAAALDISD